MAVLGVVGIAFALTFLAELPDKSMFVSLVMSTRYRALWVWCGAAAAFGVHMVISVTAGRLVALLPHQVVNAIVAGLFVAGAVYLWVTSFRPDNGDLEADAARLGSGRASFFRVAGAAFTVVFLAEWGDITQITVANLAARYPPVPVFIGATLGLWSVTAVAVTVGAKTLQRLPAAWISRVTGSVLLALGIYAAIAAARG